MDTNQASKLPNHNWILDHQSSILETQIVHNHVPFSPTYHLHHHQPPTYCQIPSTNVPSILEGQLGTQQQEAEEEQEPEEELGAMKEMMYRIAAMQPVDIDPATIRRPRRRNVRISDDPQSVAARHRRERISEKIRILQRLVPGGTKMDTASMLDEAIRYVKFLKRQIRLLQSNPTPPSLGEHRQYWQVSYDNNNNNNNEPFSSTSTWNS